MSQCVYNIYAKWNLFIKSFDLIKLLINFLHYKIESNFWATFRVFGATFCENWSNFLRKLEQLVGSPILQAWNNNEQARLVYGRGCLGLLPYREFHPH